MDAIGGSPQRLPSRRPKTSTAVSSVRPKRALLCLELHHPIRRYAINIVEWKVSLFYCRFNFQPPYQMSIDSNK